MIAGTAPPRDRVAPTPAPTPAPEEKEPTLGDRFRNLGSILAVLGASLSAGWVLALHSEGVTHDRMLPWIMARCLGLAAYVTLSALVALGIWFRHPRRVAWRAPRPESILRAHAALAAATLVLLAGHILATVLDRYAGVGWAGAFTPWHSAYRPTGVALGTIALYGMILVAGTTALAGSLARRIWLPIHSMSTILFGLCLAHGLLTGSDSHTLWWMYAGTGILVALLQVLRTMARRAITAEAL
jgi:hypothetical protein